MVDDDENNQLFKLPYDYESNRDMHFKNVATRCANDKGRQIMQNVQNSTNHYKTIEELRGYEYYFNDQAFMVQLDTTQ